MLYVVDQGNNRIRKIFLDTQNTPVLSVVQMKNLEGDVVALGGRMRNKPSRVSYTVRDLDNKDSIKVEIEIKKTSIPFDGVATFTTSPIMTDA